MLHYLLNDFFFHLAQMNPFYMQLAIAQHGFELHWSICMQIIFSKYYKCIFFYDFLNNIFFSSLHTKYILIDCLCYW